VAEETHDRARYRKGCRCDACREANRLYQREHRARNRTVATVTALPIPETVIESVVVAVNVEIDRMKVREERPADVAMALACARILDNPSALPQHAAMISKLDGLLTKLARHAPPNADAPMEKLRQELRNSRPGNRNNPTTG
jgi:hypothetical protein